MPGPAVRSPNGIHDLAFQDGRQWYLEEAQECQRQAVDADVVIFPKTARRLELAVAGGAAANGAITASRSNLSPIATSGFGFEGLIINFKNCPTTTNLSQKESPLSMARPPLP